MTIRTPKSTISDRILKIIGKKRGVIIPTDLGDNPYQTIMLQKESFWSALCRSKDEELPEGMVDLNSVLNLER